MFDLMTVYGNQDLWWITRPKHTTLMQNIILPTLDFGGVSVLVCLGQQGTPQGWCLKYNKNFFQVVQKFLPGNPRHTYTLREALNWSLTTKKGNKRDSVARFNQFWATLCKITCKKSMPSLRHQPWGRGVTVLPSHTSMDALPPPVHKKLTFPWVKIINILHEMVKHSKRKLTAWIKSSLHHTQHEAKKKKK